MSTEDYRPHIWVIDSDREPLVAALDVLDELGEIQYTGPGGATPAGDARPDAIVVSAEIRGGARGELFRGLAEGAGFTPILVAAKLRSLAQAISFFRAGAADYLSLPLDREETAERLAAVIGRFAALAAMSAVKMRLDASEERDSVDVLADLAGAETTDEAEEEPEVVDGLPIPSMWEELPCGLLTFDSGQNLVFANSLALEYLGRPTLAELEDALDRDRASFAAHGSNNRPLPDNQWPHALAVKSRIARAAVVSVERPDKSRVWLRMDCLPHLYEGKITRVSMTLVNMTGELPPLAVAGSDAPSVAAAAGREQNRQRGKKRK